MEGNEPEKKDQKEKKQDDKLEPKVSQEPRYPQSPPPGPPPSQHQPPPMAYPPPIPPTYPPTYPPPTYPPAYPPTYPPVYQQPQYPPQQAYSPMYSWEMNPYKARELLKPKESKKPVLVLIGVLLLICAAMEFPIAGMFIYYATSEDLDFGGTTTLEGKVVDSEGNNISGARVTILNTGLMAVTDSEGNYVIRSAPQGVWSVRVSLAGYKQETHKVIIHHDFYPVVDFQLKEGSGSTEINDLWFLISLAVIQIMFSFFIIAGSIFAFSQKRFAVVFVGGVMSILTMTPPLIFTFIPLIFLLGALGFFVGFCAMVITILNRKEFTKIHHEVPAASPEVPTRNQKEPVLSNPDTNTPSEPEDF